MKKTNEDVNAEMGSINREQEKVIKTLEEMLKFLKSVQIKNEDSLVNIKKPLDDLQSSLKYLPTESSFSILPTEIKTNILSYLCDSGAFLAASVCQEWEEILKSRLENTEVRIGKHCSNKYKCEDYECFIPSEVMKVSAALKLDVDLHICHPFPEVNSQLVTDGLSVSNLTIEDDCQCYFDKLTARDFFQYKRKPVLSNNQLEHLFDGIEKSGKVMNRLELKNIDLTHLDQDKLVNCFLTKTKKLNLDEKFCVKMLNVETLIGKLSQDSSEVKLSHITLDNFAHSDELGEDLADALCKVQTVELCREFPLKLVTTKKLILNILTRPIKTTALILNIPVDFRNLINPEDLRNLIEKFALLQLWGRFTLEQLGTARLVAEVKERSGRSSYFIIKGRRDLF